MVAVDISDPSNPVKAGHFQTYGGHFYGYDGNWGVYPLLGLDRVLASDLRDGFYVLDATDLPEPGLGLQLAVGYRVPVRCRTPPNACLEKRCQQELESGHGSGGFLLTIALGTGASESSGPPTAFHDPPRKGRPWKIEPAVARDLDKASENIVEVEIVASVEQIQFAPGKAPTEVWTYNGTIPGPTIEANVGDTLIVHFYNELPEKSTIHWHGLELPANMDGSNIAQNPVPPGGYFRYEFKLLRPSLFWYHPHVRLE